MMKVARLEKVTSEIQAAFVPIWVEHKRLPCTVGDRSIMAKALRVLMPGRDAGAALRDTAALVIMNAVAAFMASPGLPIL